MLTSRNKSTKFYIYPIKDGTWFSLSDLRKKGCAVFLS